MTTDWTPQRDDNPPPIGALVLIAVVKIAAVAAVATAALYATG